MPNKYIKGQQIRCGATFKDVATSTNVDPSVVTFRTKDPSGDVATFVYGTDEEVVKTAVGCYHCDLLLNEAGDWYLRWDATGTYKSAQEWRVYACAPADSTW